MHIGHINMQGNYNMSNQQLLITDQQQALESSPKTQEVKLTEKSCKTANRVLGFIAGNFKYKNKELIPPLYKSVVRQHLEQAVQF